MVYGACPEFFRDKSHSVGDMVVITSAALISQAFSGTKFRLGRPGSTGQCFN